MDDLEIINYLKAIRARKVQEFEDNKYSCLNYVLLYDIKSIDNVISIIREEELWI